MVNVNVDDVVCISLGRLSSLRAVRIDRAKGRRENRRSPVVSPHVGSVSPSHMKLPTNAQIADMNNVAGINTDVMIMTGRTNIRKRSTCVYATNALTKVRIVMRGTVCSRVVYGNVAGGLSSLEVVNSIMIENSRHSEIPVHHNAVHMKSLNFRRPLGTCRGSGSEKTSSGRTVPSRGSSESVSDSETGCLPVGGGGGIDGGRCGRLLEAAARNSGGGDESVESDGEGEGSLIGDAWYASQP